MVPVFPHKYEEVFAVVEVFSSDFSKCPGFADMSFFRIDTAVPVSETDKSVVEIIVLKRD